MKLKNNVYYATKAVKSAMVQILTNAQNVLKIKNFIYWGVVIKSDLVNVFTIV